MGGRVRGKAVVARSEKGVTVADSSISLSRSTSRNTRRRETWRSGTNDRWDSALLRARHGYIPPPFSPYDSEKLTPLSDIDKRATPPGGHVARGPARSFERELVDGAPRVWHQQRHLETDSRTLLT